MALTAGAGLVLGISFIGGGSSITFSPITTLAELLALPLLFASLAIAWHRGRLGPARWAVLVAVLITLLPLLQLLPIPAWLWNLSPARVALLGDLTAAGSGPLEYRWSLTPLATEQDFYLLLPALALFFSALTLNPAALRKLLWFLVGLIAFSTLLGFAQSAAPQATFLDPFPQYPPMLGGVFANRNHQAAALVIGLVVSLGLGLEARESMRQGKPTRAMALTCTLLALLFAIVLPLLGSRAGIIVGMVVGAITVASSVLGNGPARRRGRMARILIPLSIIALACGIWGAVIWTQRAVELADSRWTLATTTWHLGFDNAPLGSGFGSFVPMFEQATRGALMHHAYVNAAHNDFVQWWFEGGLPAVAVLLLALGVWLTLSWKLWRHPGLTPLRTTGMAATLGLLALLLHSTVDYPLRTPALMAVAGLLGGILTAVAARTAASSA